MPSAIEFEILALAYDARQASDHGNKRVPVAAAALALGCSQQTVQRKLLVAFGSDRKPRSTAGSSVLTDGEIDLIAGMLLTSANNKGQRMPVRDVLDILAASGKLKHRVSESTVNRQLRQRRLHPEQLALPSASIRMAAEHINHVWQIDSTTGAYYYMPGGRLRFMPEDEFYKNKSANLVKAASALVTSRRSGWMAPSAPCGRARQAR